MRELTLPEGLLVQCVEFTYNATTVRFTNSNKPVVTKDGLFTPLPSMAIKLGPMSGGFQEEATTIELELPSSGFLSDLTSGYAHAPVEVTISEILSEDTGPAHTLLYAFKGWIRRTIRNINGRSTSARLVLMTVKDRLDYPLGIQVNPQCWHTFGDELCAIVGGVAENVYTVLSLSGHVMTLTAPPAEADRFYHRGYVKRNGLKIGIRFWDSGAVVQLMKPAPPEWSGNTVTLVQGCDKRLPTCQGFGNEIHFLGLGYALPERNPMWEQ